MIARVDIRQKYQLHFKAVGWLLIAAVFALTVLPMHVHLEHTGDASSLIHEHTFDLHLEVDNIAPDHHEDTLVFSVTPDVMLKKLGDNPLLAAIFICLSILLLSVARAGNIRPGIRFIQPKPGWYSIAPPLRAPPRL